jgi:hypothetical protein
MVAGSIVYFYSAVMMLSLIAIFAVLVISAGAFAPTQNFGRRISQKQVTTMALKEGDSIPSVTFKARVRDDSLPQPNPFKWKDVTTDDLFKGKRCVVFALPGGKCDGNNDYLQLQ